MSGSAHVTISLWSLVYLKWINGPLRTVGQKNPLGFYWLRVRSLYLECLMWFAKLYILYRNAQVSRYVMKARKAQ